MTLGDNDTTAEIQESEKMDNLRRGNNRKALGMEVFRGNEGGEAVV